MLSDQKLLKRAAVITLIIALTGVGLLFLITRLADSGSPGQLNTSKTATDQPGDVTVDRDNRDANRRYTSFVFIKGPGAGRATETA